MNLSDFSKKRPVDVESYGEVAILENGTEVISADERKKASSIARKLFTEIDSLEDEILRSKRLASEIENRGFLKRAFSNSSKDLAAVARTQSNINRQMVDLIQETIRLNMLSYAGLICLMEEMRTGIEKGLKDANGNIIKLGDTGRDMAEQSIDIISGIIDTSKGTQETIKNHSESVKNISQQLELKGQLDSRQDNAIASLEKQLGLKSQLDSEQDEAIALLEKQLEAKEQLDAKQTAALQHLLKQHKIKDDQLKEQKVSLEKLTVQFSLLSEKLASIDAALQQHQGDSMGQFLKLSKSHWNWRWLTVCLALVPTAWLAIMTFR